MNKSTFKSIWKPTVSLFLISLVCVFLLAVTNFLTEDKIVEAEYKNEVIQRRTVFPEAEDYREAEGRVDCLDGDGSVIGYIFVTQGKGYGGAISVMTGIDANGMITGVTVLTHSETSSYGGKAISSGLTDRFKGKPADTFVKGDNIDGWTGATRTTNGVIGAVNSAVEAYKTLKEGGTGNA